MARKKVIVKETPQELPAKEEVVEEKPAPAAKVKGTKKSKASKAQEVVEAPKAEEVFQEAPAASVEELTAVEQDLRSAENAEFDEEIELERKYTVNLAHGWMKAPFQKRTKRAVGVLREFIIRNMKPEGKEVFIHPEVNLRLWENGINHPPRRIRVRTTRSVDGIVRVFLD